MTQLLRVQNFMLSTDGFGAGEGQSLEQPFGHANPAELAAWAGATASWPHRAEPGGTRGLDDYFTRDFTHNIGAEIVGRNKFGPLRGPWENHDWQGWWGVTSRRSTHPCSSSLTTRGRRSRWLTRRSISSTRRQATRCASPKRLRTARTSASGEASRHSGSFSRLISSTRSTSPSPPPNSAVANGCGTTLTICSTDSTERSSPARAV